MLKKSFKRVMGILLALLLLLGIIPIASVSANPYAPPYGTTEDGFTYRLITGTGDDRAVIEGYVGELSDIYIPDYIYGYPVKYICGFGYNDNLTSVSFADSITTIGADAFYDCKNLEYVYFPSCLTEIESQAFSGCTSLKSADIPYGVTAIASYTFSGCTSLSEISIPSSVETIGEYAFYDCKSLASLYIPDGVKEIQSRAFAYCTNLSYVRLPSTITTLTDAFFNCSSLTHVTVPSGVTKINDGAFSECTSLESVTLPESLESISGYAFYHCSALKALNIADSAGNFASVDGVLYNKDKTKIICYPAGKENTEFSIPSDVTAIGDYAFNYAQNLKSIAFPESVQSIGEYAFRYCTAIEALTIPENASISYGGFDHCTGLTTLTLPSSVTEIGSWGFANCTSLTDVYYLGTRTQWNSFIEGTQHDCLKNANVHCLYDCAELKGNSITLFGDIGVNFYMNINEDVFADEDATVIFTYDGNVVEVPVSEGEETENGYKYTCNIPAKDMITEVTCMVETYEGESKTFTYTVKDYAEIILANPDTYGEKAVALVKAMLNYGAAAQTYFGHNTDTLANDTEYMTEAEKAVPEKDFSSQSFTLTEGAGDVRYYGTALSLKSQLGIKHYFILGDNVNAEELKCTVDGEVAELSANGNLYEFIISDIPAQNLYKKYEVKVGDLTLSYCVMDYAATAQSKEKEDLLKVMYALDAYTQCAVAYMNQ